MRKPQANSEFTLPNISLRLFNLWNHMEHHALGGVCAINAGHEDPY